MGEEGCGIVQVNAWEDASTGNSGQLHDVARLFGSSA